MADKRVVVTGLGLVCGLGNDVQTCWSNAVNGVTGIDDVKSVDTANCYAHKGAEVDLPNEALSSENYDRSSLLCIKATAQAVEDAKLDIKSEDSSRIGVILGSCVGGAASLDKYYTDEIKGGESDAGDIWKMSASAIANNVAKHFGLNGTTANIVNACAAGTMSIAYACDLIRAGKADAFIAGGTDSFSSLAFSGFHALHALDTDSCSPFNRSSGITLGEGSGVLIVESYEHAKARGAKIYCDVLGSGVSSDAHHITAPRPDGMGQMAAIKRAVENSALDFNDIDYINAHGTGTAKNDEAEFLSLHTLFDGSDNLSVSSTKSMTGHCLGAAGSIEAVFSVKSVCDNVIPPTIGYTAEDLDKLAEKAGKLDFVPNTKREKTVTNVMSNSFAFGGNNASIIFSKNPAQLPEKETDEKVYITGAGKLLGTPCEEGSDGLRAQFTSADFKAHGIKMAFFRKLDRFSQLQLLSGVSALENAGITVDETNENNIGIVIGTADGPLKEIADFQINAIKNGTEKGSAFAFPNTVYNAAGGYLSIFSNIRGYNATVANSIQAGLQSVCYAVDVIKAGEADVMLAAGTDENTDIESTLSARLGITGSGKPYSGEGIALGEGSVTLVLEKESAAKARNAEILAEIAGCATAHGSVEAFEISGSQKALEKAIKDACADACITPDGIDAVCGFANGNKSVDALEKGALNAVFGKDIPVLSVKEQYGEARAATAALSAAYAAELLAGKAEAKGFNADNAEYILAVSFGLGGSYSAVVIKKA